MKLIINIPEVVKHKVYAYGLSLSPSDKEQLIKAIMNGTPIPGNATNGDVIKAMFPNIDFTEMAITVHATTKVTSNGVKGSISYDFWKDWWNALYQKGGKE